MPISLNIHRAIAIIIRHCVLRKLLMHRRQVNKLLGLLKVKGTTLIPLKLYFNASGFAKLELRVARGKSNMRSAKPSKTVSGKKSRADYLRNRFTVWASPLYR